MKINNKLKKFSKLSFKENIEKDTFYSISRDKKINKKNIKSDMIENLYYKIAGLSIENERLRYINNKIKNENYDLKEIFKIFSKELNKHFEDIKIYTDKFEKEDFSKYFKENINKIFKLIEDLKEEIKIKENNNENKQENFDFNKYKEDIIKEYKMNEKLKDKEIVNNKLCSCKSNINNSDNLEKFNFNKNKENIIKEYKINEKLLKDKEVFNSKLSSSRSKIENSDNLENFDNLDNEYKKLIHKKNKEIRRCYRIINNLQEEIKQISLNSGLYYNKYKNSEIIKIKESYNELNSLYQKLKDKNRNLEIQLNENIIILNDLNLKNNINFNNNLYN